MSCSPIVLKVGSTDGRHGYLRGLSLRSARFIDVFLFNSLRVVVSERAVRRSENVFDYVKGDAHELFHDPGLAAGGIVLATVNVLLALADISFTLGDFQFTFKQFLSTGSGPAWRCERVFFDNLLDNGSGWGSDGLEGRRSSARGAAGW